MSPEFVRVFARLGLRAPIDICLGYQFGCECTRCTQRTEPVADVMPIRQPWAPRLRDAA